MKKYICAICGYVYDEAEGCPEAGIAPGTKWEDLPDNWVCPLCGAVKADFSVQQSLAGHARTDSLNKNAYAEEAAPEMRELSPGELSAVCSNLAKGCEKQYLTGEAELFTELSDYFRSKIEPISRNGLRDLLSLIASDLESGYPGANGAAEMFADRGAKRSLVWSEKVTRILSSLLARYEKDGGSMLQDTGVYVCTVCGFVYIGDAPPDICPVCKVPEWKFAKLERR